MPTGSRCLEVRLHTSDGLVGQPAVRCRGHRAEHRPFEPHHHHRTHRRRRADGLCAAGEEALLSRANDQRRRTMTAGCWSPPTATATMLDLDSVGSKDAAASPTVVREPHRGQPLPALPSTRTQCQAGRCPSATGCASASPCCPPAPGRRTRSPPPRRRPAAGRSGPKSRPAPSPPARMPALPAQLPEHAAADDGLRRRPAPVPPPPPTAPPTTPTPRGAATST